MSANFDAVTAGAKLARAASPRELGFTVVAGVVNEAELALNNNCD